MRIDLRSLDLKTFTEQNIKDYCSLNSLNISDITELYIYKVIKLKIYQE